VPAFTTQGIDHVALAVADLDRSEAFIEFQFSDHGLAHSIYFEDPDGYRLELTTYEM
jgi:catechol 2,3-dioxygenase-like lactoylglutathione lyase family enzyme